MYGSQLAWVGNHSYALSSPVKKPLVLFSRISELGAGAMSGIRNEAFYWPEQPRGKVIFGAGIFPVGAAEMAHAAEGKVPGYTSHWLTSRLEPLGLRLLK